MAAPDTFVLDLGNGACLRLMAEDDVTPAYVDALNDPDINRFLAGARTQRQTAETVRAFVRHNREDSASRFFGLFLDGRLVGTCRLHDLNPDSCWLGLVILDKSLWGQGWATRVIAAATGHAHGLGIKAVRAAIEADNQGSCRAFAKAGFGYRPGDEKVRDDGRSTQVWQHLST